MLEVGKDVLAYGVEELQRGATRLQAEESRHRLPRPPRRGAQRRWPLPQGGLTTYSFVLEFHIHGVRRVARAGLSCGVVWVCWEVVLLQTRS